MLSNSFCIVEQEIRLAYNSDYCAWSIEDCISLFDLFYRLYYLYKGCNHPHLSVNTVQNILPRIDCIEDSFHTFFPSLNDYEEIITSYFNTRFENCNYSISHFMSGSIRINRCYELGLV